MTAPPGPGTHLGRYQLLRRLATGGMAEIYLGRTVGVGDFSKVVVVKRILPHLAGADDFRGMFLDEARLAATLHHPNIAQVFDVGQDGADLFFAMEYVAGRDLHRITKAARARDLPVPMEIAVAVVMGAAAGLHHAHEKTDETGQALHIVHRDVSPPNIIVGFDGAVKLVDFGIAKAATQRQLTREGLLKGKVAYMSPEQCMGLPVDRRSDVFALGILLYELTTDAPLFSGDSDYAILHKIADTDVPRPSSRKPGFPPALEAICMRALQRQPESRYRNAEELQIDLETFAREANLVTSPIEIARFMRDLYPEGDDGGTDFSDSTGEQAPLRWRGDGAVRPFHPEEKPTRTKRSTATLIALMAMALAGGAAVALYRKPAESPPSPPPSLALPFPAASPPPKPAPVAVHLTPAPTLRTAAPTKKPGRRAKSPSKPAAASAPPKPDAPAKKPAVDLDAPFPPF